MVAAEESADALLVLRLSGPGRIRRDGNIPLDPLERLSAFFIATTRHRREEAFGGEVLKQK